MSDMFATPAYGGIVDSHIRYWFACNLVQYARIAKQQKRGGVGRKEQERK